MNMDALVTHGRLPWVPNPDASDLEVWWMYQTPLVGRFTVGESFVVFTVLGDSTRRLSIWAYVPVDRSTIAEAEGREFGDVDELDNYVASLFEGRRAVIALANQYKIEKYEPVQVDDDGLLGAANRFLDHVLEAMRGEDAPHRMTAERAQRAQLDAATHELEVAL